MSTSPLEAAQQENERLRALLWQVKDKAHRTVGIQSLDDALFTLYAIDDLIHLSGLLDGVT